MPFQSRLDTSRRVLVVDDFPVMRKIIRQQLECLGYSAVDTAHDGDEALQMLNERHYDLVISDWNMVPMPGAELVKAIRANANLVGTKVLMITAESRNETLLAARNAGVDGHLLKPFDTRMLGAKIAMAYAA